MTRLTTSYGVYRFNALANARSFQNRATKTMGIILGDDGRYWVVTGSQMARLIKAGYDAV